MVSLKKLCVSSLSFSTVYYKLNYCYLSLAQFLSSLGSLYVSTPLYPILYGNSIMGIQMVLHWNGIIIFKRAQ